MENRFRKGQFVLEIQTLIFFAYQLLIVHCADGLSPYFEQFYWNITQNIPNRIFPSSFQSSIGCYDILECDKTPCPVGCASCYDKKPTPTTSDIWCSSCLQEYFWYQEKHCIPCPIYEEGGDQYKCSQCLKFKEQWPSSLSCQDFATIDSSGITIKRYFPADDSLNYRIIPESNPKTVPAFQTQYCGKGVKSCQVPLDDPKVQIDQVCMDGYYANTEEVEINGQQVVQIKLSEPCQPCQTGCLLCQNETQCLRCPQGTFLDPSQGYICSLCQKDEITPDQCMVCDMILISKTAYNITETLSCDGETDPDCVVPTPPSSSSTSSSAGAGGVSRRFLAAGTQVRVRVAYKIKITQYLSTMTPEQIKEATPQKDKDNPDSLDKFTLACLKCREGMSVNPDLKGCSACGEQCKRCVQGNYLGDVAANLPKIFNEDELQEVKFVNICQQCLTPFKRSNDMANCQWPESIDNCFSVYYGTQSNPVTIHPVWKETPEEIPTKICYECSDGKILQNTGDTTECIPPDGTLCANPESGCKQCQQRIITDAEGNQSQKIVCFECDQGYVKTVSGECTKEGPLCAQLVDTNCKRCYQYLPSDKSGPTDVVTQCTECKSGQIPTLNGCIKCPANCAQCAQTSYSQDLTKYIRIVQPELSQALRSKLQTDWKVELTCMTCNPGTIQISTGSCVTCGPYCMSCITLNNLPFCETCLFSGAQTSKFEYKTLISKIYGSNFKIIPDLVSALTPDQSDCQFCSFGCLQCLDYNPASNQYFDSQNMNANEYAIFGRECLTCNQPPDDAPFHFALSQLTGRCVPCSKTDVSCIHQRKREYYLSCFLSTKEPGTGTLDDPFNINEIIGAQKQNGLYYTLDEELFELNEMAVQEIEIVLYLIFDNDNTECALKKHWIIQGDLKQTVYSLHKLSLKIIPMNSSPTNRLTLQTIGPLEIKNFDNVQIENIIFQSALDQSTTTPQPETDAFTYQQTFGLNIISHDTLINHQFRNYANLFSLDFVQTADPELRQSNLLSIRVIGFPEMNITTIALYNVYLDTQSQVFEIIPEELADTGDINLFIGNLILDSPTIKQQSIFLPIEINRLNLVVKRFIVQNPNLQGSSSIMKISEGSTLSLTGYFENILIQGSNIFMFSDCNIFLLSATTVNSLTIQTVEMTPTVSDQKLSQIMNSILFQVQIASISNFQLTNLNFINLVPIIQMVSNNRIKDGVMAFELDTASIKGCQFDLNPNESPLFELGSASGVFDKTSIRITQVSAIDNQFKAYQSYKFFSAVGFSGASFSYLYSTNNLWSRFISITDINAVNLMIIQCAHFQSNQNEIVFQLDNADSFADPNIQDPVAYHLTCLEATNIHTSIDAYSIKVENYTSYTSLVKIQFDPTQTLIPQYLTLTQFEILRNFLAPRSLASQIASLMLKSESKVTFIFDQGDIRSNYLIPSVLAVYEISTSGIFLESYQSSMSLTESEFTENYSPKVQSCLFIKANRLEMLRVHFSNSSLPQTDNDLERYNIGGFGQLQVSFLLITNCLFENSLTSFGGALYIQPLGSASISIDHTQFINVKTSLLTLASQGGAIIFRSTSKSPEQMSIQITNCLFRDTRANLNGGAILIDVNQPVSLIIVESSFERTRAISGSMLYGELSGNSVITLIGITYQGSVNDTLEHLQIAGIVKDALAYQSLASIIQVDNMDSFLLKQSTFEGASYQAVLIGRQLNFVGIESTNILNSHTNQVGLLTIEDAQKIIFQAVQFINSVYDSDQIANAFQKYGAEYIDQPLSTISVTSDIFEAEGLVVQGIQCNRCTLGNFLINSGLSYESNSTYSLSTCTFNKNFASVGGGLYIKQTLNKDLEEKQLAQDLKFMAGNFPDVIQSQRQNGSLLRVLRIKFQSKKSQIIHQQQEKVNQIRDLQTNPGTSTSSKPINTLSLITFTANQATLTGGALFLQNIAVIMDGVSFSGNNAALAGALYFSCLPDIIKNISVVIKNSQIENNTATNAAGFMFEGTEPQLEGSNISGNTATQFGNNEIKYPPQMVLFDGFINQNQTNFYNSKQFEIINYQSGSMYPRNIYMVPVTDLNDFVPLTKDFTAVILPSKENNTGADVDRDPSVTVEFNETVNAFVLDNLIFKNDPYTVNQFQVYSDGIRIPVYDDERQLVGYVANFEFQFKVIMRNCYPGQVYEQGSRTCFLCPKDSYSLPFHTASYHPTACKSCPYGIVCPGSNVILIPENFWRKDTLTDVILICENNIANCLGNPSSPEMEPLNIAGDQTCQQGNIGALCEECDLHAQFWSEPYSHATQFTCAPCRLATGNNVKLVGVGLWTLINIGLSVQGTVQNIQKWLATRVLIVMGFIKGRSVLKGDETSTMIQFLNNYLQILQALATFDLPIPASIMGPVSYVGNPSGQMSSSLDCALKDMVSHESFPTHFFRLLFSNIYPIIFMICFYFFYKVFLRIAKLQTYTGVIETAYVFLFLFQQPSIIAMAIDLISCRVVGGVGYIKANVAYQCNTDEHIFYSAVLCLPVIVVWLFVLPYLIIRQIVNAKNQNISKQILFGIPGESQIQKDRRLHKYHHEIHQNLSQITNKQKFGFLINEFKTKSWFWEFVQMYQRIFIIIFLTVFAADVKTKGILIVITIFIYSGAILAQRPYNTHKLNNFDYLAAQVAGLSILIGVFLYQNNFAYLIVIGYVILIVINGFFSISIILKIIFGFCDQFEDQINKVLNEKLQKFTFLQRFFPPLMPPQRKSHIKHQLQLSYQVYRLRRKMNPHTYVDYFEPYDSEKMIFLIEYQQQHNEQALQQALWSLDHQEEKQVESRKETEEQPKQRVIVVHQEIIREENIEQADEIFNEDDIILEVNISVLNNVEANNEHLNKTELGNFKSPSNAHFSAREGASEESLVSNKNNG